VYSNPHTNYVKYKSIDNTHSTKDLYFTSRLTNFHFTSLHLLPPLDVSSSRFKSLHRTSLHFTSHHPTSLILTFLTVFLKTRNIQRKVSSTSPGSWFQCLMVLFTKKYFPITVLCFLALIFLS